MLRRVLTGALPILMSLTLISGQPVNAESKKPTIHKPCMQCHQEQPDYLWGTLKATSNKAKTIQISMGSTIWQTAFDEKTVVNGAPAVSKIDTDKEIKVKIEQRGNQLVATAINVKQPATMPQEWVITVEEMQKLMAKGPKAGNFVLYDARPAPAFLEGHIDGAISNYDAAFEKNLDKLPKDKNKLLVFYCGGVT